MVTREEMAAMSGEGEYKNKAVFSNVDEIKLGKDAKAGTFLLTQWSGEKDEDGFYPQSQVGNSFKCVFLKIRRKMVQFENNAFVGGSNEYNSPTQIITLSNGDKGVEAALKKQFPGMKVQLIVYALYEGRVVKFTVSGSSLFTDDPEKPLRLYNYLQTFDGDTHTFEYETTVKATQESFQGTDTEKTYYALAFERGKKLTDGELVPVGEKMQELHEMLVEQDAKYGNTFRSKKDEPAVTGNMEYPGEEISPDDIPF